MVTLLNAPPRRHRTKTGVNFPLVIIKEIAYFIDE